jgi:hypothetical protein
MIDETQTKSNEHSEKTEEVSSNWHLKTLNLENLHPEIAMKKEKIFSKTDFTKRKTKIICTLG